MDDTLQGIALIEKDNNDDVLVTWTYPGVDATLVDVAKNRTGLDGSGPLVNFTFSRFKSNWIYIYTDQNKNTNAAIPRVRAFSIVLFSSTFHPEKYGALTKLIANQFNATGSPVEILDRYLAAMGGFIAQDQFNPESFGQGQAYLATSIRDIINLFEDEIIHIWNALLMKKRVVVYADKIPHLLKVIRALPLLVFHRQDWNILRPYVTSSSTELEELQEAGVYVAGVVDIGVKRQANLYDLFVNVTERSVTIADHAAESFTISSFHADITSFLTQSVEGNATDKQIIKELTNKTNALLQRLESLKEANEKGENVVTLEGIQARKLPAGMDHFLFEVASAEGMTHAS